MVRASDGTGDFGSVDAEHPETAMALRRIQEAVCGNAVVLNNAGTRTIETAMTAVLGFSYWWWRRVSCAREVALAGC